MLERYNKAKQNNVAVSAIWIQDWAGVLTTSFGSRLFWDWKWNQERYPGNCESAILCRNLLKQFFLQQILLYDVKQMPSDQVYIIILFIFTVLKPVFPYFLCVLFVFANQVS